MGHNMDSFRKILEDFYSNLTFIKVKQEGDFVIYAAKIETLMGHNPRFVLAIVPHHLAIKNESKLKDLYWRSLQTRNFSAPYKALYNAPFQTVRSPTSLPWIELFLFSRDLKSSIYKSYFTPSLMVQILRDSQNSFPEKITLSHALNSWNCIIYFQP